VGFAGGTAVTLNAVNSKQLSVIGDRSSVFGLQVVEVDVVTAESRALTIRWLAQECKIWLDAHNWPVKMNQDDGLTAVETRPVWHE